MSIQAILTLLSIVFLMIFFTMRVLLIDFLHKRVQLAWLTMGKCFSHHSHLPKIKEVGQTSLTTCQTLTLLLTSEEKYREAIEYYHDSPDLSAYDYFFMLLKKYCFYNFKVMKKLSSTSVLFKK